MLLVGPDGALSGEAVAAVGDRRVVIVGGDGRQMLVLANPGASW